MSNQTVCASDFNFIGLNTSGAAAVLITVGTALFAASNPAQATTANSNLTVNVNITASCVVNAATLSLGNITANSVVGNNSAISNTNVTLTCSNGTPYNMTVGYSNNTVSGTRYMVNGNNTLSYELCSDSACTNVMSSTSTIPGTANGTSQSVAIYGRVLSQTTAPAAGNYSDTSSITVSY